MGCNFVAAIESIFVFAAGRTGRLRGPSRRLSKEVWPLDAYARSILLAFYMPSAHVAVSGVVPGQLRQSGLSLRQENHRLTPAPRRSIVAINQIKYDDDAMRMKGGHVKNSSADYIRYNNAMFVAIKTIIRQHHI